MSRRTSRSGGATRDYPRTARLNHLLHEIVAEEIERIDDDRLGLFTVVAVDVEADMRHAVVWYSALGAGAETGPDTPTEPDDDLVEALAEHRGRLQAAIGRQARIKRTPELTFRPDTVVPQASRVEQILQDIAAEPATATEAAAATEPATGPGSATGPEAITGRETATGPGSASGPDAVPEGPGDGSR